MLPQEDINDPGGRKKINWRWIAFLFLAFAAFNLTTPFMYYYPTVITGVVDTSLATSIVVAERGSLKRQVTFLSAAGIALLLLAQTKNRFQMNGVLSWLIILYLVWIVFSITWTINLQHTTKRLVLYLIVWFSAVVMAARLSIREVASFAFIITGVSLVVGIGNELRLGTIHPFQSGWRFAGMMHFVPMGWNCGLLAFTSMFLFFEDKRRGYRIFAWFVTITAIFFMYSAGSRGAFLGTFVVLGYYWLQVTTSQRKLLVLLAVIMALSVGYVAIGDRLLGYGKKATALGRGEEALESASNLTGRVPLWKYSFKYILDRPFRGYGFTTFVNPRTKYKIFTELGSYPAHLHSIYVNELMGTGFIGLGAMILMFVLALSRAFLLSKSDPAYLYVFMVIIWAMILGFTELGILYGSSCMTFIIVTLLARVAFLPAADWR